MGDSRLLTRAKRVDIQGRARSPMGPDPIDVTHLNAHADAMNDLVSDGIAQVGNIATLLQQQREHHARLLSRLRGLVEEWRDVQRIEAARGAPIWTGADELEAVLAEFSPPKSDPEDPPP